MARFPKIQSPCPYKADLATYLNDDVCSMCKRQVHDLSAMSQDQRETFLAGCGEEICVSYKVPARVMIGAAIIATSLQSAPLAASEFDQTNAPTPWLSSSATTAVEDCDSMEMIIVGGIKKMSEVEYINTEADLELPEIPIVYENELEQKNNT